MLAQPPCVAGRGSPMTGIQFGKMETSVLTHVKDSSEPHLIWSVTYELFTLGVPNRA